MAYDLLPHVCLQAELEQQQQLAAGLQQQLASTQQLLEAARQHAVALQEQLQQAQAAGDAAEQRAASLQAELDRATEFSANGMEQMAAAQAAAAAAQAALAGEAAGRAAAEAAAKDVRRRLAAAERMLADVGDRLEMKREQQMVVASGMANVSCRRGCGLKPFLSCSLQCCHVAVVVTFGVSPHAWQA